MKAKVLILTAALLGASLPALSAPKDTVVRDFTAFGGGDADSWRAVVKGKRMSLETVRGSKYYPKLRAQRSAYAKGVEFTAQTPQGKVVLNIRGQRCRDDNGKMNEFTAVLHYRGKSIKGCAVRGAYPHAPT